MIYQYEPTDFKPCMEVVSCFVISRDSLLLLYRNGDKPYGNKWGVPAGKTEKGESPQVATVRELFEETGIATTEEMLKYHKCAFVRYPDFDFVYHIFSLHLQERPSICINPAEHQEYCWASPQDALLLPLIPDEDECIKSFWNLE